MILETKGRRKRGTPASAGPAELSCMKGLLMPNITAAALILVSALACTAQTAAYKPPRTADGHPDLNGIWQALNSANWDVEDHAAAPPPMATLGAVGAAPPGLGVVEGGSIP